MDSLWHEPQRSVVLALDQNSCWNFRDLVSEWGPGPYTECYSRELPPPGTAKSVVGAPPPQAVSTTLASTATNATFNARKSLRSIGAVGMALPVVLVITLSPYGPMQWTAESAKTCFML